MKPWMWFAIAFLVIIIIIYFLYQNQQAKIAALNNNINNSDTSGTRTGSSKFADILNAIYPFYNKYLQSK